VKPGGWNVRETGTGCKDGDGERTESGIDCHPGDAGGGEAGDGRCLWNCLELRIVKMQLIFCRKNQEWGCRYRFKWLEMKRLACHKHQEDLFGKVENFL